MTELKLENMHFLTMDFGPWKANLGKIIWSVSEIPEVDVYLQMLFV